MDTFKETRLHGLHLQDGKRVGEAGTNVRWSQGKLIFFHHQEEESVDCENPPTNLSELVTYLKGMKNEKSTDYKNALKGVISHLEVLSSSHL